MEVLGWRSDAELVDGVRRGEDFAFGRLFERWFGRVLGVAQDILGDPQAAAEVATDTFHALWYHLDRLDDPEGFGAWAVETSRTFAHERLASPVNRDKTAPVPTLATAPDAAAAVAVALVARGLPSAAGLGQALQSATGAIASPFGPATAGAAGSAPAPAGFAGAVPSAPAPAGFAGATLPAPPQAPPAGYAGGAPGFAGTPGSGSILGGAVGQAADMATHAMPSLGAFDAVDDGGTPRVHRYEPPPGGGLLRSPQALAGIAAAVILVLVGALLLLTRGDDTATAASEITTTLPPAAPSISEPTSSASASTEAPTSSATSDPATTSISEGSTTSSTRATTSTTRATTTSTATTRATTTATSASTTGSTTATTGPTTPTTGATTSSSSVTRTTPTTSSTSSSSSSSSSSSTLPKPVITVFTVSANPRGACAGAAAELLPYTASWSASNADTSSLAVNGVTYDGAGKGSKSFCALTGTRVALTVTGPGGKASQAKTTP